MTAKVRQGRRPRGRVADRLQNSSLEEKRHCERYMCALRARASLGRFVVMRCSVSHIMSIGPRMDGVLRALQTLMHADLAACVPLLSQVRNAMVRAAPRKADDRHLLRQCPERAHRHHRCPTGLTPEAHHVSPRAATPSPPASADADALRRLAGGWQASCSNCRPRPPQHGPGRTAPILPPCAHRAARALRRWSSCFPPPAVAARCAIGRRFAGVCVGSDFSFPEGGVGGVLLTRRRTCAPHLHALPSPSSTDNMFTIGSVCIDRQGFHWKGPECAGEGHPAAQILKITV